MYYKILIEPAKSSKSTCKNCNDKIDTNTLKVKVVDARKFNAVVKKYGKSNLSGEGFSRGYFQCMGPKGQHVSIQKYWVHLDCYQPIQPHPFTKDYFDTKTLKNQHKEIFQNWLNVKNSSGTDVKSKKQNQKKTELKEQKKDKTKKTKKIVKIKKQSGTGFITK